MKRVGNIFEKICDIENIYTAIRNAARGKKHRKTVAYVLNNQEKAASLIQEMLVNKTYKPKPYRTFEIKDGKIAFVNAKCRDGLCEKRGFLFRAGDTAACLPNRTVITVKGENRSFDGVSY